MVPALPAMRRRCREHEDDVRVPFCNIGRHEAHRIWPAVEARSVAETTVALELPGGSSVMAPAWEGNGVRSCTERRSQIGGRCGGKAARR
jgi:hypothetical protein